MAVEPQVLTDKMGLTVEMREITKDFSVKLYRVQIGAYSVKSNVEAQLARARKAGFSDAFIRYD
jgi:N-acetylmuramoyl-L-alanine amidase